MMKYIKTFILLIGATFVSAASHALEDNYLVGSTWGGAGAPKNWSLGHSSLIDNDIYLDYHYYYNNPIDGVKPTAPTWYIMYWLPSSLEYSKFNSLTIQNIYNPVDGTEKSLTIANATTTDVYMGITKNLNVFSTGGKALNATIGKGGAANKLFSIRIGGDFVIGSADMTAADSINLKMGETGSNTVDNMGGLRNFTIDGGIKLYGNSTLRTNVGINSGSLANFDMKVAGTVTMTSAGNASPTWFLNGRFSNTDKLNTFIDIGGLQGTGMVRNDTKTLGGTTTLVFRTAEGVTTDFAGTLQDDAVVGGASKVNIIMAGTGTQILRNVNITGTSDLKRGTLLASGSIDTLLLAGTLGAISQNSDIGQLSATKLTIYDGCALAVDIDGIDSDLIAISGALAGTGVMSVKLGSLQNVEIGRVYDIMTFDSTNLSAANFKLTNLPEDYEATLSLNGKSLSLVFTAVPEPAAFALVFGVIALVFIARRKR